MGNIKKYFVLNAAITCSQSLNFEIPIWILFFTQYRHFSYTQTFGLSLIAFGLSIILEVPTGRVADKYGRIKILRLGFFLESISILGILTQKSFFVLVLTQIISAFGLSMISGTLDAELYVKCEKVFQDNFKEKYLHYRSIKLFMEYLCRSVACVVGGISFYYIKPLPYLLYIIFLSFGLFLSFFIKEELTKTQRNESLKILEIINLLKQSQLIKLYIVFAVCTITVMELAKSFTQPILNIKTNSILIGLVFALLNISSALGSNYIKKLYKKIGFYVLGIVIVAVALIAIVFGLFSTPILFIVSLLLLSFVASNFHILLSIRMQNSIDSSSQATVTSLSSFAIIISNVLPAFGLGLLLDHNSLKLSIVIVLFFSLLVFIFLILKYLIQIRNTIS